MELNDFPEKTEALRQKYAVPGMSVAVSLRREIVFAQVFGLADLDMQTPLQASAVMPIGSVTKTFIATLFMQLVEHGVVGLEDPLTRYLPEYPIQGTTLRQLAAHTSGLPLDAAVNYPMNYTIGAWPASGGRTPLEWYASTEQLLASLPTLQLEFSPESGKVYSNLGICLLGVALERAAGQGMIQMLYERIFAPLGMASTELVFSHRDLSPAMAARMPVGYVFTNQGRLMAPAWELGCAGYTGGICCTASDLARFLAFHLTPTPSVDNSNTLYVLSPDNVLRMRPAYAFGDTYLGWWKGWHAGYDNFGHAGGHLGYMATALAIPQLELGVTVLTNRFNPVQFEEHSTLIAKDLLALLAPRVAGQPKPAFDPAEVDLHAYVGQYVLPGGYIPVRVDLAEKGLTLTWLDRSYPAETYFLIGQDQFSPQGSPIPIPVLTFTRDAERRVTQMTHALFAFHRKV